jgi:hypothetical protein
MTPREALGDDLRSLAVAKSPCITAAFSNISTGVTRAVFSSRLIRFLQLHLNLQIAFWILAGSCRGSIRDSDGRLEG